MKLTVCLDGDGHFKVARLENRDETLKVLKAVSDGDYFEGEKDTYEFPDDYSKLSDEEWEEMIGNFTQRGTLEIIEI